MHGKDVNRFTFEFMLTSRPVRRLVQSFSRSHILESSQAVVVTANKSCYKALLLENTQFITAYLSSDIAWNRNIAKSLSQSEVIFFFIWFEWQSLVLRFWPFGNPADTGLALRGRWIILLDLASVLCKAVCSFFLCPLAKWLYCIFEQPA